MRLPALQRQTQAQAQDIKSDPSIYYAKFELPPYASKYGLTVYNPKSTAQTAGRKKKLKKKTLAWLPRSLCFSPLFSYGVGRNANAKRQHTCSPPRDVRQSPCSTKMQKLFPAPCRLLAASDVSASRPIVNFKNSGHPPEPIVDVCVASRAICWPCLRFPSV